MINPDEIAALLVAGLQGPDLLQAGIAQAIRSAYISGAYSKGDITGEPAPVPGYIVIDKWDPIDYRARDLLIAEVNRSIAAGWAPVGGVAVTFVADPGPGMLPHFIYSQAMIRPGGLGA